ncbi:hypothetical protein BDZ45DRAFT_783521, partial [Acephala macrosclerotiorum]
NNSITTQLHNISSRFFYRNTLHYLIIASKTINSFNRAQNALEFELNNPSEQSSLFKAGLFKKKLEKVQSNPDNPRMVTVSYCNCPKKWTKQLINHSTSNYKAHLKSGHKVLYAKYLNPEDNNDSSDASSSQMSITDSFSTMRAKIIKLELQEQINSGRDFSLTLDVWTAINQDAYLGITIITRDNASSNDTLIDGFKRNIYAEDEKNENPPEDISNFSI